MEFEDKIKNINNDTFVERRLNQIKYLIYENLALPKESVNITATPRRTFSKKSNQYIDVFTIEFQINIEIEVDPVLDEFVHIFNKVQKNIVKVFKKLGINQFLELIKDHQNISYNYIPMVIHVNWVQPILELHLLIDYETIEVEGAGDL